MKFVLTYIFLIYNSVVFSQLSKKDLVDTQWYSDNTDSSFYKSDTFELTQYAFLKKDDDFKRHIWQNNPKLFLNRRLIRRTRFKLNDREKFNDFAVYAFERNQKISVWNCFDGGYKSQSVDGYYWRWKLDKPSQTLYIYDKSNGKTVWTLEILESNIIEAISAIGDEERKLTRTLKIKKHY